MAQRKVITIEDYTYGLLQEIVAKNMAPSMSEAVKRAAANYLGIQPKSKDELRLEEAGRFFDGIREQREKGI